MGPIQSRSGLDQLTAACGCCWRVALGQLRFPQQFHQDSGIELICPRAIERATRRDCSCCRPPSSQMNTCRDGGRLLFDAFDQSLGLIEAALGKPKGGQRGDRTSVYGGLECRDSATAICSSSSA